jgi:hypothetical protein
MQPDEIEQMLFDRATRSKLRAPLAERLSNLAYNRVVTSGVIAGAALVCTLAMTSTVPTGSSRSAGFSGQQITDTKPSKQPEYRVPAQDQNTDSVAATLAMTHLGN